MGPASGLPMRMTGPRKTTCRSLIGKARDRSPERHELVLDLDRSSGSRLGRVLLVEDHYFRGWSRLQALEAIVVLKPLFGPWRRIVVPVVLYRFAQVQSPGN